MENYKNVLRKYKVLEGRAGRKEYWMFILFNFIFIILALGLDFFLQIQITPQLGLFYTLYVLFMFMPLVAVTTRRLHDVNQSGWWVFASVVISFLVYIVPVSIQGPLSNLEAIVAVIIVILTLSKSNTGENKYGLNPNSVEVV